MTTPDTTKSAEALLAEEARELLADLVHLERGLTAIRQRVQRFVMESIAEHERFVMESIAEREHYADLTAASERWEADTKARLARISELERVLEGVLYDVACEARPRGTCNGCPVCNARAALGAP